MTFWVLEINLFSTTCVFIMLTPIWDSVYGIPSNVNTSKDLQMDLPNLKVAYLKKNDILYPFICDCMLQRYKKYHDLFNFLKNPEEQIEWPSLAMSKFIHGLNCLFFNYMLLVFYATICSFTSCWLNPFVRYMYQLHCTFESRASNM